MIQRFDEARNLISALEDPDEQAFLDVAFKTAAVDIRAGWTDGDFDYLVFVRVMRALYAKKTLLQDVLDGKAAKHRWWDDV